MAKAAETRERIICAAEDVVIRDGVAKLTLDSAAHEAGVSKGGVLYHFPSRAALVAAMVDRFVERFDADLAAHGAGSGERGAFVRAYIDATVTPSVDAGDVRDRRISAALLAGAASDPELLLPLRERFQAWQAAVENDGVDKNVASMLRLAADGMWLCDLFDLAPADGDRRRDVAAELLRILDSAVEQWP